MKEFRQHTAPEQYCTECCTTQQKMMSGGTADAEAQLKPVMDAHGPHGGAILQALGQQLDVHLSSLEAFQRATETLTLHCRDMVLEIAKLLEVIHQYQVSHAHVLAEAELLRRIIADFAQFVHATAFAAN